MKPLDYDPQKKYPLVVCLHGGTWGLPPDAIRHVEVPEPSVILSNQENRKKYSAFLFVPQCPPGASWGGVPGYPAADSLVFETMQALEEEFRIDEKRRYVAGGSGGGMGSWHFIGTRPDMFAAAIPFCGAGNPALAPKMMDVPVWAFHGSVDRNVPVSGSRDMVAAIRKAGGKPRYTEFPGVGHNVWPSIISTPGVLDWLFTQKRD
jgi:predicted peptidase